jgi:hypothetical protein
MLMCEAPDGIYTKIGLSDDPVKRMHGIVTGCPLVPGLLAYAELPNRRKALNFEQELHCALGKWRRIGEWFLFQRNDKPDFNRRLQDVAKHFASPSWPIRWKKLALKPIRAKAEKPRDFSNRKPRMEPDKPDPRFGALYQQPQFR